MLAGKGLSIGVNLNTAIRSARWLEGALGRELPGKMLKAVPAYPSFEPTPWSTA